jgi:transcriptional regulator with XRE-family HTH domain
MGEEGEVRRFGEKLRTLRTQRGLTTRELAKALGITNGSVSNIETGKTKPNIDLAHRVATYFGVTTDDLLDDGREV